MPHPPQPPEPPSWSAKHIIAVGAGKGGVGKSTVAVMLAVGLARLGARTGLLDGDIYGPSMPTMLGLGGRQPVVQEGRLLPFDVHGTSAISLGALVEPESALIWRGPKAHSAFQQLLMQSTWGTLDYLIVDLPPGTGDVPLSLSQLVPLSGAVIVCTPQAVAQDDATRAIAMFRQLEVDILGIVENMSIYIDDQGKEHDLFGRGGGRMLADRTGTPFLGELPLHPALRTNADGGTPLNNWSINAGITEALDTLCRTLADALAAKESDAPSVTVRE